MSVVICVRIPRKLKKQMDMLRGYADWSEEIRKFIERRVEELHRVRVLEEVRKVVEQLPEVSRGTVTRYVREDRDSN
ncbi:MAG: CopG family transcriptional regulator [Ignisphaera sp.]